MLDNPDPDLGNLSLRAYTRCKALLLSAELDPGSVVSQADLSARLKVPVTPLRDALRTLQAEGLVQVLPRAGIRIVKPDAELVRNTFQLRRLLEGEAIRRFTETAAMDQIEDWIERHRVLQADLAALSQTALRERSRMLDRTFHAALVASLRNSVITKVYERNEDQITLVRNHLSNTATILLVRQTLDEHGAILSAVARRDQKRAGAAMHRHMERSLHRALGI